MSFAGHLPTMRFDLAEWQAMPVFVPRYEGDLAPNGHSRVSHPVSGKPLVIFCGWGDYEQRKVSYAVRPIVRVPMGRRELPSTVERETVRKFQKLRAFAVGGWAA